MADDNIHTGFWVNYSKGRIYGATITLTSSQALALVSFLAVLITHTGSRSFKILRFTIHQSRKHEKRRDGLGRQQDVLFRNAETDMGTFLQLFRLAWNWKGYTTYPFLRSIILLVLVLLHFVGFLAAGIASSFVANGNFATVIAKGTECGVWVNKDRSLGAITWWQKESLKSTTATQAYVRLCYENDPNTGTSTTRWSECKVFTQRKLEWSATHNVSCPFSGGICLEGENAAYMMDTGLQSSRVLGINSPIEMQWQHQTTCSPIKTEGYTEVRNGSGKFGEDVTHYLYGPVGGLGDTTHWVSDYEKAGNMFTLNVQSTTPWIGEGILTLNDPIPPLRRDDSDVSLLFLSSNGVSFYQPVDDPIFSAHKVENFTLAGYESLKFYESDNLVGVIGCVEQTRFCNPQTKFCTPFLPSLAADDNFFPLTRSSNEEAVFMLLRFHVIQQSVFLQSISSGASVLAVNDHLYAGTAQNLTREQWKVEMAHLFDLGLAATQVAIVGTARQSYPQDRGLMTNLLDKKHKNVCKMIEFHESGYSSISLFWLVVILASSVLITVLSNLDGFVGKFMWKRWPRRVLAWRVDSALWLLRMCYEQRGVGSWKKDMQNDVPVTDIKGEVLGVVEVVQGMVRVGGKEGEVDLEAWGKSVGLVSSTIVQTKDRSSRRYLPRSPTWRNL